MALEKVNHKVHIRRCKFVEYASKISMRNTIANGKLASNFIFNFLWYLNQMVGEKCIGR